MNHTRPVTAVALLATTFLIAPPAEAQIRRSGPAPDNAPANPVAPPAAVPAPAAPAPDASIARPANGMVMSGKVENGTTAETPAGPSLGWPPKLPPFLSLEVMLGSRANQNVRTDYAAFKDTSYSVPVTNQTVTIPDIAKPELANQEASGASLNSLKAELSFLFFSAGVEAAGFRQAPATFQSTSVPSTLLAAPAPLLSQGYTGFYGKALGFRAGYRRETYRGVPGVDAGKDVALNEFLVGYGLGLGIGPVSAGLDILGGVAPLTVADGAATASTIVPAEAEAALGLTLWGIKFKAGQRFRLTGYGSDFGSAFGSLLGGALPGGLNPSAVLTGSAPDVIRSEAVNRAKTIQDTFRSTIETGPFIEAGVSF
ncbi:MAG: hypothetical protein VKO21_00315 [Candidatus Sericytochromatia bacterium]|nr:hypothetical protein [Candidatus Sericytochromatia bacterium]